MVFLVLVLALVCAWLICQFIRKFGKRFFTRFIPKFILVLSVLLIGFVVVDFTYHYTKDYVCDREFLQTEHMLPKDLVPQIREYGIRRVCRRWYWDRRISYEEQEAMAKEQFLNKYDEFAFSPPPRGSWGQLFHALKFRLFLYRSEKKGYL